MAKIAFSFHGDTPFQRLMGHNPEILKHWNALEYAFSNSSTFSADFKEELRKTLAWLNKCEYCMAKGKPSDNIEDEKTKHAIHFAKLFSQDPSQISENNFSDMKHHFTEPEIAELCALIVFISASQKFGSGLNLQATCQIET